MMDETNQHIVRYILEHPGVTASDILMDAFDGRREQQSMLYRRLEALHKAGHLSRTALYPERGAASPHQYFVKAMGAHALGERMPRDHAKPRRRDFRLRPGIIQRLRSLADQKGWYLIEENADMRAILAGELKKAALSQFGQVEPDYIYQGMVPRKVEPDLLLYTGHEAHLIIISHPHAGRFAFKARLRRYAPLLPFVRLVCYALTPDQQTQWERAIKDYDTYHHAAIAERIHVVGPAGAAQIRWNYMIAKRE